jgi:hypothetical protein
VVAVLDETIEPLEIAQFDRGEGGGEVAQNRVEEKLRTLMVPHR